MDPEVTFTAAQLQYLRKLVSIVEVRPGIDMDTVMYQAGMQRVLSLVEAKTVGTRHARV